jgi:hypothetical protein
MEAFGSFATTPLGVSVQFAEMADLVILLVANSYGTIPPDGQLSFTQYKLWT